MEISVHACLEDRDAADFTKVGSMGVVVKGTGDQYIEVGVGCLSSRFYEIRARDRPEFRPDKDTRTFFSAIPVSPST